MGRISKLTLNQWADIEQRLVNGATAYSLAKEFGISSQAIVKRFGNIAPKIKFVANQILAAEKALFELPKGAQITTLNLVDELKAISTHAASAAKHGMMTASKLSRMAATKADFIDETEDIDNMTPALRSVAALTAVANETAKIGLNLLAANKETIIRASNEQGSKGPTLNIIAATD